MKAMVFAAGLGTRLKPITDSMPKALVPVCGRPLLYHVLCKLRDAGYDDIVVNVHHFPEQIRDYLQQNDFGVRIAISDESALLRETGGAIRFARPLLESSVWDGAVGSGADEGSKGLSQSISPLRALSAPELSQSFLVHNVDIISNLNLEWFRSKMRPDALATLLVSERNTQRYLLFTDDMRLVGWTNIATGEVRSPYPGLKPEGCRRYAFAGIHNISTGLFKVFDEYGCPERFPIMDFYLKACAEYPIYGAVPENLTIIDVGKLDTLAEAERICYGIL